MPQPRLHQNMPAVSCTHTCTEPSHTTLILITKYSEEAAPQHRSSRTKRCQIACGHLPPLHCLAALQQLPLGAELIHLAPYPSTSTTALDSTQPSKVRFVRPSALNLVCLSSGNHRRTASTKSACFSSFAHFAWFSCIAVQASHFS